MNIIYLVEKKQYIQKMSRIRFRTMEALAEKLESENGFVKFMGPGWDNWDLLKPATENIKDILGETKVDLIVCYKPGDIYGANDLHKEYKCCIRYNEMYDKELTLKEIIFFGATLVVCHHYNDFVDYSENHKIDGVEYKYIPHSADETAFKKWGFGGVEVPKIYDVLLVGATGVHTKLGQHYPLRDRMKTVMSKLPSKYNWGIFAHPSYIHEDAYTNAYADFFAKALNSTKIAITDSGAPKSRFGKYVEIPACHCGIAADMPETEVSDENLISDFLIEINMDMSDEDIIKTLVYYLENEEELNKKIELGVEYANNFTTQKYAERFLEISKEF